MKLVFVLEQSRQSSSNDDSTQTMPHEGDSLKTVGWKKLNNVIFNFSCQSMAHFDDIGIGHVFIGGSAEKGSFRVQH